MPSPLVLLQGCTNGQGCPQQGNQMETIPSGPLCLDSQLRWICLICLLLVITLTKPVHQGFSALVADSSAGHGGRECQMWLMGSHCICHTPGLACSAPSAQVVNHCPLVLALLPTPGAVGHAIEVAKGIWVVYSHQSHNLWRLRRGYHMEELEALG